MPVMDDRNELVETKVWLRGLREQAGMSQAELATRCKLNTRSILNAENPRNDALPRGLPFLRMLRVLGVVVDGPAAADPLEDRLRSLEEKVDQLVELSSRVVLAIQELRRVDEGGREGLAS